MKRKEFLGLAGAAAAGSMLTGCRGALDVKPAAAGKTPGDRQDLWT